MYFMLMTLFFMLLAITLLAMVFMTCILEHFYILEWNIFMFDFFFDIKLYFYFDYVSNLFLLIISLISMSAFYYSKYYMEADKAQNKFIILTFLFVMSMYLMVLGMNMYMILIGWDGLGVISYFLVIHYYSENSHYSGMITVMTNRLGDVGMILSMFLLMNNYSLDIIIMNIENNFVVLSMIFLLTGAFTKSAQFPFSAWLPLAMAAPTPISALVHSSTLVTAGVYLFIRFEFLFSNQMFMLNIMLIMVGITMLISGVSALFEMDIKKIIAFSTLSQLSLMMMIVIMGDSNLSFFHIMTHALYKALLFLCSGIFIHEHLENQDVRNYSHMMKINIFVVGIFLVCSLSLAGFPFLSGFYSKDLILEYMYMMNYNLFYVIMLIIMTMITVIYSVRMFYYSLLMGKTKMKYIYYEKWSKIYNSLFLMFFGVLFLGACLSWILLEKFNIMYFNMYIKMLNILLILISVIFIYKWDILTFNNMNIINIFSSMFYLTSFQGYKFNLFLQNSYYLYYYSEYMLESVISTKISGFIYELNNMMKLYKMMEFYLMFMLLLYFYIMIN
uniref:NADH-ubiquinone oxidoreductase chain 5 n=1 Tax=Phytoseiulus persimilis TaxID=44414 RepID=D5HKV6_PHYPM|nr:NADH dehydrogenase subunit 5 [Phytoseiulus persimilis]